MLHQKKLMNYIYLREEIYNKWMRYLKECHFLYLSDVYGSGKTCQAIHFGEVYFKEYCYIDCSEQEYLQQLQIFMKKRKTRKTLLILDNMQVVVNNEEQEELMMLFTTYVSNESKIKVMMLSHAKKPSYLVPLRVSKQLYVLDKEELHVSSEHIKDWLDNQHDNIHLNSSQIEELCKDCMGFSKGYPLLIQLYLEQVERYSNDIEMIKMVALEDLYYHLDTYFKKEWDTNTVSLLTCLGVFTSFTYEVVKKLFNEDAKHILSQVMKQDSFLTLIDKDTLEFHEIYQMYFEYKLNQLPLNIVKDTYEKAGAYFEEQRHFEEALRCYHKAHGTDKISEIVIYLLENADGCVFAKLSANYIDELEVTKENSARVIGAKAMLAAYRMDPVSSNQYLAELKKLTMTSNKDENFVDVLSVYVRTLIASPCVSANELKENFILCMKYVKEYGFVLKNIMPTSNSDSIINGGIDLIAWIPYQGILRPLLTPVVTSCLGVEGVGVAECAMGEMYYELNDITKAMAQLTSALSDANLNGSIRTQYAITGIMSRLLQSEGQLVTAQNILHNIENKAKQQNYLELLPNISSSIVRCMLLNNDVESYQDWFNNEALDEFDTFYITNRYQLLSKAYVYVALNRTMEALHVIQYLYEYAQLYHRNYLMIELQILKAIILYRREEEWETILIDAIQLAQPYGLIRIFADQGNALYPLWKEIEWKQYKTVKRDYVNKVKKALETMSIVYPNYLKTYQEMKELSKRELEVLHLLANGENNTQIAERLKLSLGTIKFHVSNVIKKLGAENRTEAVNIAKEAGLI